MPPDIAQTAVNSNGNDKRGSPRARITRTVHMGTGLGPSLECELKDLSAAGARLRFNDPNCAPQEFLIRLDQGVLRWCQVIWRSKTEIGIRFIKIPKSFRTKAKTKDASPANLVPQSENNATDTADKEPSEGASPRRAGAAT
jgi:PilZ domain